MTSGKGEGLREETGRWSGSTKAPTGTNVVFLLLLLFNFITINGLWFSNTRALRETKEERKVVI
jgi:hypothetical protein